MPQQQHSPWSEENKVLALRVYAKRYEVVPRPIMFDMAECGRRITQWLDRATAAEQRGKTDKAAQYRIEADKYREYMRRWKEDDAYPTLSQYHKKEGGFNAYLRKAGMEPTTLSANSRVQNLLALAEQTTS